MVSETAVKLSSEPPSELSESTAGVERSGERDERAVGQAVKRTTELFLFFCLFIFCIRPIAIRRSVCTVLFMAAVRTCETPSEEKEPLGTSRTIRRAQRASRRARDEQSHERAVGQAFDQTAVRNEGTIGHASDDLPR
jgi:hypothetical protein